MAYRFMERQFPGRHASDILKKVALNTALLGCIGNWCVIFSKRMLAGGAGECAASAPLLTRVRATGRTVNDDWLTVMSHDLKVWPLTDLLVFSFVPIHLRVAFVSTVSVCWQTYLSYTASQGTAATSTTPGPFAARVETSDSAPGLRRTL